MNNKSDVVTIPKPKKWSKAFSSEMSVEKADFVMQCLPFSEYLEDKNKKNLEKLTSLQLEQEKLKREYIELQKRSDSNQLESLKSTYKELKADLETINAKNAKNVDKLQSIILNEAAIHDCEKGDVILREGDYGVSVFFILQGSVSVVFDIDPKLLGHHEVKKYSFKEVTKQLLNFRKIEEARDVRLYQDDSDPNDKKNYLSKIDISKVGHSEKNIKLNAGDVFGEIGALRRMPRSASVIADQDCRVLEMKWQGVKDLMRFSKLFKKKIDTLYRERSLRGQLISMPLFSSLPQESVDSVMGLAAFEDFGKTEWNLSFNKLDAADANSRLESEELVVNEGDHVSALYIVRSGFGRVSHKLDEGHKTVDYLKSGDVFGLKEIIRNSGSREKLDYQFTLRAVGYLDLIRIPASAIEHYVLPRLTREQQSSFLGEEGGLGELFLAPEDERSPVVSKGVGLMEFFVEQRFINGSKTMLLNLDKCTGCDDCVRACATTHNNNPRFVRHGKQHVNLMVANACMHCHDPVCMIGCPTGAIHRAHSGEVVINDVTCIGCATCANSCPYGNIKMVEIQSETGQIVADEKGEPIVKATKCDLCVEQWVSPACEKACPHDALRRIDIHNINAIDDWLDI